jgi:hypothetical protein
MWVVSCFHISPVFLLTFFVQHFYLGQQYCAHTYENIYFDAYLSFLLKQNLDVLLRVFLI